MPPYMAPGGHQRSRGLEETSKTNYLSGKTTNIARSQSTWEIITGQSEPSLLYSQPQYSPAIKAAMINMRFTDQRSIDI